MSAPAPEQLCESLRMMYREHTDQARHYDTLRERSTTIVGSVAAAALAYIAGKEKLDWILLVPSLLIIFLGLLGACLSHFHWEKNRQHVEIARAFRLALQSLFERRDPLSNYTNDDIKRSMKWLADEFPEIADSGKSEPAQRKISFFGIFGLILTLCPRGKDLNPGSQEKKNIDPRYQKYFKISEHGELTKACYDEAAKQLDCDFEKVVASDFSTIRNYGDARYSLKRLGNKTSLTTESVHTGWAAINFLLIIFGAIVAIYILCKNILT